MSDWAKEYARKFHSDLVLGGGGVLKKRIPELKPKFIPVVSTPKKGYIYYAGDGNGRIKIGFSANPWSRINEMRCANPSIEILVTERVDDGLAIERERHKEFNEYHLALEWFSTGERLIRWINHLRDNVGKGVVFSNPPLVVKHLVRSGRK